MEVFCEDLHCAKKRVLLAAVLYPNTYVLKAQDEGIFGLNYQEDKAL